MDARAGIVEMRGGVIDRDVKPSKPSPRAFAFDASCHCEERSDAAIPIQLRRFLEIASLRSQ
jgi:hypothetical protein